MKTINNFINEALKISSKSKVDKYTCHPKDKDELRKILEERLEKKNDKNADLNDIDVSKITDMSLLFYDLDPQNINVSEWDVSNVTDMDSMFWFCKKFNADLSNWDVSNVENMHSMFVGCTKFEGKGLDKWNPKKLKKNKAMFKYCLKIKNKPSWYEGN